MKEFERSIESLSGRKTRYIACAHPFKVGLPAMRVARKLNKPFVYEVRGLWEESAIANRRYTKWSFRYWRFRLMETRLIRLADRVFCLSDTMKEHLIRRGVERKDIAIIRNGAPEDYLIESSERVLSGESEGGGELLKIQEIKEENTIIGYVGSIQEYEGLKDLTQTVGKMISENKKVHLLIVSNSGSQSYLEKSVRGKGFWSMSL